MMNRFKGQLNNKLQDNFALKGTALVVAIILWVVLLGRKDFSLGRDVEIQLAPSPNVKVVSRLPEKLFVEVKGPRMALKKFSQEAKIYTLDVSGLDPGTHFVSLNGEGLSLPLGLRAISFRPSKLRVVVEKVVEGKESE